MKKLKKVFKWIGIVVLIFAAIAFTLYLIYLRPFIQKMKVVSTVQYDKGLTIVTGGGGNSGILSSDSLVIVVDTKMDDAAKTFYEQVKQIAGNKPILVINTHFHPDHVGGNKFFKGSEIIAGGTYTKEEWLKEADQESLPTMWLTGKKDIKMGEDTITVLNLGKGVHTAGDLVVYSHQRKLLFGGDVILNKQNAIIMGKGRAEGYLWAFDTLQTIFDIQHVVPGHGAFGGNEVIKNFENYFKDMKLAATDATQKKALTSKYEDWGCLPVMMSPNATIRAFKREMK